MFLLSSLTKKLIFKGVHIFLAGSKSVFKGGARTLLALCEIIATLISAVDFNCLTFRQVKQAEEEKWLGSIEKT